LVEIPGDLISALRGSAHTVVLSGISTAALPFEALETGATLVEVNPGETPLTSRADHVLRGPAGDILPRLIRELSQ
jgi:NAD-dependent SIR2 family protein deacetylase